MEVALTYIYGIGKTHAKETLAATGVSPDLRQGPHDEDLLKLRNYIDEHFRVEGDLRREVAATSAARWRSAATRGCVTVVGSRCTAAHQDQCALEQGPAQDHRGQEEGPLIEHVGAPSLRP